MNRKKVMKAAIKLDQRPEFILQETEVPDPQPDEALIKVKAAGLCGTDMLLGTTLYGPMDRCSSLSSWSQFRGGEKLDQK